MRVLQVVHCYLPRHSAGAEVYTARLVRALRERGHEVQLFFAEKIPGEVDGSLLRREHEGAPCHVFVNNLLYEDFRQTFEHPVAEARFDEVLDSMRPDVVHVQHLLSLSLGLVQRARLRGIPVVMTLHDFWSFCPRMGQLLDHEARLCSGPEPEKCARCLRGYKMGQSPGQARMLRLLGAVRRGTGLSLGPWIERWRRRRRRAPAPASAAAPQTHLAPSPEQLRARSEAVQAMLRQVQRFVSPSRTVAELSVELGLPAQRCELLPYGFLAPGPRPARRARPTDAGLRIGFVGTLRPHKGADVLIQAFVQAAIPGAQLSLWGDPRSDAEYGARLRQLAADAPVLFLGQLENAEVPGALAGLDLLVVPSVWRENAPVVIQEARWVGVPVVASRLGGMAEAVREGVDGRCFEPGDAADLARVLGEVAGKPELVEAWSAASEPPFPMDRHVDRMLEIYDGAVGEARS